MYLIVSSEKYFILHMPDLIIIRGIAYMSGSNLMCKKVFIEIKGKLIEMS